MSLSTLRTSPVVYEKVKIISYGNGRLSSNLSGLKTLLNKIPNIPIVIISVEGKYRNGKTTVINVLVPVLEYYSQHGSLNGFNKDLLDFHCHGFEFKSGSDSVTVGIDILNHPFIIPNPNDSSKKLAVLLMDTQGLDALDVARGVDEVIVSMTHFLSSHVIYNIEGNVEPRKIEELIRLASHSENHSKNAFCSLDILIRDYGYTKSSIDEMKMECKKYINEMTKNDESNLVRNLKALEKYFRFINYYPLPKPGSAVEKKNFSGEKEKINIKFIELLNDYMFILFDNKHINPKFNDGEELYSLFESICNSTINDGRNNVDECYRMITENNDNRIINNFKTKHLNPLKSSYLNMSESEFNSRISSIRNEYDSLKKNNSLYNKSKLNNINFENEISSLQNQYRQKLERERLEAERIRQEQLLQQQRAYYAQQQAEEERRRREIERLLNIPPPPPVYIEHHHGGGCRIM